MELKEIVSEMSIGLQKVDETTETQNSANAETSTYGNYLKGVGCLGEHQFRDELMEWWNETLNKIDLQDDRDVLVFVGGPAIFPWHLLPSNIKYRPVIGQLKPISWSPKSISHSNPNYNTATLWTHGDVNPNFGASDDHEKFIGTDEFKEYAEALRNRHFGASSQVIEDANEVSFVCQNPINKDVSKGISLWYHTGHGDARFGLDFKTKS